MPVITLPERALTYHLICFDKNGSERSDDPDGLISLRIIQAIAADGITDVFIVSHGWKGDVPAAIDQYNRWIGAMQDCTADRDQFSARRPGFKPLIVGFHWPSLPFGDEELRTGGTAFGDNPAPALTLGQLVDLYADRLCDTPATRNSLRTILSAAIDGATPDKLPDNVKTAYTHLDQSLGLGAVGPAGAPGADREPFDPERAYQTRSAFTPHTFGTGGIGNAIIAPLQQLSFWTMKDRGRRIGETAGSKLLQTLQNAGSASGVRFHLVGHSFGCVVVSAMANGTSAGPRPAPVDSLSLIQGALSLWSYATEVPGAAGQAGYFHELVAGHKVKGALISTQSRYDTAVGKLYPVAAGAARQVTFAPADLPKYGALGSFGAQGAGVASRSRTMVALSDSYKFEPGTVYNIEASEYICQGSGPSGAHSDIAHPEVAHAVWEAAMTGL